MSTCASAKHLQLCVMSLACITTAAYAQQKPGPLAGTYPNKTIRMLVPTAAGSGNDAITRILAQKLSQRLGQSVVVDNRTGANGVIAMDTLAQATPDGYVLMSTGNLIVLNGVQNKVSYDVRKAFDPVVQTTTQPYLLLAIPSLQVGTIKELVAYAKMKPGTLSYGSSGVGSINHLGFERLNAALGVNMVHVPYKGSSQAFVDLMSGAIQLYFSNGASAGPYMRNGRLKGIAVASLQRMQAFPDILTIAESGVPGFELSNSYSFFAPAGTPQAILMALNREVNHIVNTAEIKDRLTADGIEPGAPSSPGELKKSFVNEYVMWDKFMKTSGIKLAD